MQIEAGAETRCVGDAFAAFPQPIQREKKGADPVFAAVDAVEVHVFPDLGRRPPRGKPVPFEIPVQTVAETTVFGRHRVEHGPVAVDADQEVMAFRDGFEFCAGIWHGKREIGSDFGQGIISGKRE